MKIGLHDKLRVTVAMSAEQMRDKRVDEVAFKEVRRGLDGLGFDVSSWEKRDLLQGAVPVVFQGRPYDIKKQGPDITISDGVSNKMVAEIKNATNPENAKKFVDTVKRYTERLASMYSIAERLRFTASLVQGTLAPEMFESMKEVAPKLVEHLIKQNIIPPNKKQEAEKEITRARIPAPQIPKREE